MSGRFVCSTRWEQLNGGASSRNCMPNWANHNRLATLRLEYVNDTIFLITYIYIYIKSPFKIWEFPNVKLNAQCEHKGQFYMNIKKHFKKNYQNQHLWCLCKVRVEVAKHWLWSTPSHELPTQQVCDHFPLWHVFTHSNHLQIAWLMCLCIDIHVGFTFEVILIVDEWVGCC